MRTIIKKTIAFCLAISHFLSFASTTIPRESIVNHLNEQLSDFRAFYKAEEDWLETKLLPLVNELITGNKMLDKYEAEIATWGSLESISKKQPITIKIRASQMLNDVEDAGLYLYIAELNLKSAVEKHLDSLSEIYEFTGQVGAKYDTLKTRLTLILSIYEKEENNEDLLDSYSSFKNKLQERLNKIHEAKERYYSEELLRINNLLILAKKYQSRTLWLASLRSYHSLLDDKKLLINHTLELNGLYEKIISSEVSIVEAKNAFKDKIATLEKKSIFLSTEGTKFFNHFFIDPAPRMNTFLKAEEFIAEAINRAFKVSQVNFRSNFVLAAYNGKVREQIPENKIQSTTKIYNTHDNENGKIVEKIHLEVFTKDSKGNIEKKYERVERGDSNAAKQIREALGIQNTGATFGRSRTELIDKPSPGGSVGELSQIGPDRPTDLPSPSNPNRIKSKVVKSETPSAHVTEVQIGETISPKDFNADRKEIYSAKSLIDRIDVHNGSRDFSEKTYSFDKNISDLSKNVSNEIRVGETTLQAGFVGLIETLRAEMNKQTRAFPEASTFEADGSDAKSIKNTIVKAKTIVSLLRKKLDSTNNPNAQQIELGLNTADVLLDSATKALNDNDIEVAKELTDLALNIIADYGPATLHMAAGFLLGGDLLDLVEVFSGKDALTGEELSNAERIFSAIALIAGNRIAVEKVSKYLTKEAGLLKEAFEHANKARKAIQEAKAGGKSVAVLGKVKTYNSIAKELDATFMNVPKEIWDELAKNNKAWPLNEKYLDRIIRQGKEIILSNDGRLYQATESLFGKELRYLESKGFKMSPDGLRMVKQ